MDDDLVARRFTWPFYRRIDDKIDIVATVAKVLDPNRDPRCADAKIDPDLLCVQDEYDLGQCNQGEIISSGYLSEFLHGHFYIVALWSHGAKECEETKRNGVAFFTRLDKTFWKKITDQIEPGRCHLTNFRIQCFKKWDYCPPPKPTTTTTTTRRTTTTLTSWASWTARTLPPTTTKFHLNQIPVRQTTRASDPKTTKKPWKPPFKPNIEWNLTDLPKRWKPPAKGWLGK